MRSRNALYHCRCNRPTVQSPSVNRLVGNSAARSGFAAYHFCQGFIEVMPVRPLHSSPMFMKIRPFETGAFSGGLTESVADGHGIVCRNIDWFSALITSDAVWSSSTFKLSQGSPSCRLQASERGPWQPLHGVPALFSTNLASKHSIILGGCKHRNDASA